MFSFSLGLEEKGQKSYMILGGTNQSQFIGDLTSFPLKNNFHWALDMRELKYG